MYTPGGAEYKNWFRRNDSRVFIENRVVKENRKELFETMPSSWGSENTLFLKFSRPSDGCLQLQSLRLQINPSRVNFDFRPEQREWKVNFFLQNKRLWSWYLPITVYYFNYKITEYAWISCQIWYLFNLAANLVSSLTRKAALDFFFCVLV